MTAGPRLVWDTETDGLLHELTRLHCITTLDMDTGEARMFNRGMYDDPLGGDAGPAERDGSIEDGLRYISSASFAVAQNDTAFDIPAILKVYPQWQPPVNRVDTLVLARVAFPNIADIDIENIRIRRYPPEFLGHMIGSHSLKAWGLRLGVLKGDYEGGWSAFTPEMDKYARQDPVTTLALYQAIERKQLPAACVALEMDTARIIQRQYERGFAFDTASAMALVGKITAEWASERDKLAAAFQPWLAPDYAGGTCEFTPKSDNRKFGYVAGATFCRIKQVVFNPASRDHIADRLIKVRGWTPTTFTPSGKPQVDEVILGELPWAEAKIATNYLLLEKRLGQIANGKEAWLNHAKIGGITGKSAEHAVPAIHGKVNTGGAVTGRMTHSNPNVAQTPACGALFGTECRQLWTARAGFLLIGCDAEGLELRGLAHFMARWDGGAYGEAVVNGDKAKGTDVHTLNKVAAGLNTRDAAKTFIYALIYGAGDAKLGKIAYDDFDPEQKAQFLAKYKTPEARLKALKSLGKKRRANLMDKLPALASLVEAVKAAVKARGYLVGLDGRKLHVRSEHGALNTLLQSAGALAMKQALVFLDESLRPYRDAGAVIEPVANIHDEFQIEAPEAIADEIGKLAADCIRRAGEHFKFRCPLAGAYNVGRNWAETH